MFLTVKVKRFIAILLSVFAIAGFFMYFTENPVKQLSSESYKSFEKMQKTGNIILSPVSPEEIIEKDKDFIKWVDFSITSTALKDAMKSDISSYNDKTRINWIKLLACLGVKYGGYFKRYKKSDLEKLVTQFKNGEKPSEISSKYYDYYHDAYSAVLSGYIGEYTLVEDGKNETKYGLKAFSPIANGYYFSHFDDFGSSRSYGYKRKHLGHDLMASVGTPVIAVESGTVEALGWNQYGGWRIGIRSFDKKRYYYYAHLRKDHPYAYMLTEGSVVKAGDVIGYVGMTGYSAKENVNNIDTPHLHFGIQLIFDESQKDGNGEIWIDCYEITKFLLQNKSSVYKDTEKNDYFRKTEFFEKSLDNLE